MQVYLSLWLRWHLGAMPYGNDPHYVFDYTVEESVRFNDHFTVGQIGKFGQIAPRIRKPFEPLQGPLCSYVELLGGSGIVAMNILDCAEKLFPAIRSESDSHIRVSSEAYRPQSRRRPSRNPLPQQFQLRQGQVTEESPVPFPFAHTH